MGETEPLPSATTAAAPAARSPITPSPPERLVGGWVVSYRKSRASLTLTDLTPLTKVLVRAPLAGKVAAELRVPPGRADRVRWPVSEGDDLDVLLVGSGPGEWTVLAAPGLGGLLVDRLSAICASTTELVTVLDVTHGRALVRLTGPAAVDVLAKECAVDLSTRARPDGSALRTDVAGLATDIVRCDLDQGEGVAAGSSYLLHCERSSGQYLYDSLRDAGAEFGMDVDGFGGLWPQGHDKREKP